MSLPTHVQHSNRFEPADFETVVNHLFNGFGNPQPANVFPVDVREDQDHLYVDADLPGFKKEEVDITLENQTLTVTADRKADAETKGEHLLQERRRTKVFRTFKLPPTIDEQIVSAKLTDGVLTVTLNKREETKPRKITVG